MTFPRKGRRTGAPRAGQLTAPSATTLATTTTTTTATATATTASALAAGPLPLALTGEAVRADIAERGLHRIGLGATARQIASVTAIASTVLAPLLTLTATAVAAALPLL